MALKPDRIITEEVLDYFMDEVADRGGIVSLSTGGSGVAMDSSVQLATYKPSGSGAKPLGVLLVDMKSYDLTKTHKNYQRNEVNKGGKVTILRRGQVTTDMIVASVTPAAGDPAYVGPSGLFTNTTSGGDAKVGSFDTAKDESGFARVSVNLPL